MAHPLCLHPVTKAIDFRGGEEKFQLIPMRYIRVEMFGNTLNKGNHLVELIAR